MSLEQWAENGWVRKVAPTPQGLRSLLSIADRELADAGLDGISSDGRFEHAYSAARCLAEAALYAAGFSILKGQRKHERLVDSLKLTVEGDAAARVDYYDQCRRLRHKTLYEQSGIIERSEADNLLRAASELKDQTLAWLSREHADLLEH